jgi:hypothetical protein
MRVDGTYFGTHIFVASADPIFEAPTHVFVVVVRTTSHELWRHHNYQILMLPSSLIIRVFNSTMSAWCTFATDHLHDISPFPSAVIRDIVNMAKCLSTTLFHQQPVSVAIVLFSFSNLALL